MKKKFVKGKPRSSSRKGSSLQKEFYVTLAHGSGEYDWNFEHIRVTADNKNEAVKKQKRSLGTMKLGLKMYAKFQKVGKLIEVNYRLGIALKIPNKK